MKLSNREIGLAWITTVTVILGVTYWVAQSRVQEWKDAKKARVSFGYRIKEAEHLLQGKEEVDQRLAELQKELPSHPMGKDVTAEVLRMLERTAQQHNLTLLRREAEKEKHVGDLYEVAINCTWEGDLDAIIHFLYALQAQGAILDVRQLTMSPMRGGNIRLKGNCTIDYAYTRPSSQPGPGAPSSGAGR